MGKCCHTGKTWLNTEYDSRSDSPNHFRTFLNTVEIVVSELFLYFTNVIFLIFFFKGDLCFHRPLRDPDDSADNLSLPVRVCPS